MMKNCLRAAVVAFLLLALPACFIFGDDEAADGQADPTVAATATEQSGRTETETKIGETATERRGGKTAEDECRATLELTASGTTEYQNDTAVLHLSIDTESADIAAAKAKVDGISGTVTALATANGIAEQDIKSTSYQVGPVYEQHDGGVSETELYYASRRYAITVRDLNDMGVLVNAVPSVGESNVFIEHVEFVHSDPDSLQDAATAAAVKRLQERAAKAAESAGMELGPMTALSEQHADIPASLFDTAATGAFANAESDGYEPQQGRERVTAAVSGEFVMMSRSEECRR